MFKKKLKKTSEKEISKSNIQVFDLVSLRSYDKLGPVV